VTGQKLWTRSFMIISVQNFLIFMNFYLLMIVVSKVTIDRFDTSAAVAGLAASIFALGGLVARPFAGKWVHSIGQTTMLYASLFVCLVLALLYFAAVNTALMLIIRFLHGVAFGAASVATGTIVAGIVPKERYGEGIGYYALSQTLAAALGPSIGLLLIQHSTFRSVIIVCSIASALGLLLLPFLGVGNLKLTAEEAEEARGLKLSSFIEPKVIPISSVFLVTFICYSSTVSFMALYAQEIHLEKAASVFFIVYAAVVFISRPYVGRRFDNKGENSVMYMALPIFAIGFVIFSQAHHGLVLLLAAAVIAFGFGAAHTSSQAIAVKITPPHRRGLATSTFYMFSDIGMGVGPLLWGLIIPLTGYRGMFVVVAIVAAACLALYYGLHGRRAGAQDPVSDPPGL
jgi:MFS family permease